MEDGWARIILGQSWQPSIWNSNTTFQGRSLESIDTQTIEAKRPKKGRFMNAEMRQELEKAYCEGYKNESDNKGHKDINRCWEESWTNWEVSWAEKETQESR